MIPLRPELNKITDYTPGEYRKHAIKLSSNENPLGTAPLAIRQLQRLHRLNIYPEPSAWILRKALASRHQLEDNQIIIGNGSGEILLMIASAFVAKGKKVLIPQHSFSLYEFTTQLLGGQAIKVPMKDIGWLDLEAYADHMQKERPRMVILCNPNNPTGTVLEPKALLALLQVIPQTTAIVIDEAYADYATNFSSAITHIVDFPNLIVLRTFSKIYGLAGLRVGYGMAQKKIINILHRVRLPFNTSMPSQQVATAALADTRFVARSRQMTQQGKEILTEFLSANDILFFPSEANFMCMQTPMHSRVMAEEMAVRGITIRPLTSFGLPSYVRVTIGKKADMEQFCSFFSDIISH